MVHWGNVDTGSMVNIMYQGVLEAFPELHKFKRDFQHVVQGVGNKETKVVCKLIGVPVSVGADQVKGSCRTTTFYVLDCPTYHCILGLPLLQKIEAGIFCSTRKMQIKLGKSGGGKPHTIPLMPRSWVKTTPAYLAALSSPPPACQQAEWVPEEAWEGALAVTEQVMYVQEALVDLLGAAAINNENAA
jgi:hypothetical protein